MDNTYLPGTVRDRSADLIKKYKVTQTYLALKIGSTDSMLSRFLSGRTDKLSDENIIRIARVFNVSTASFSGQSNFVPQKSCICVTSVSQNPPALLPRKNVCRPTLSYRRECRQPLSRVSQKQRYNKGITKV